MMRWLFAGVLGCMLCSCASAPKVSTPRLDQCRAYLSQGKYDEAEPRCSAAFAEVEQVPGAHQASARQLMELASSAIRFGDYRVAERAAELALPFDENALATLALAKYKLGDYDAAIARSTEYLGSFRPGAPTQNAFEALEAVALAQATLENFGEARRMLGNANAIAEAGTDRYAYVSAGTLESSVFWMLGSSTASGEMAGFALNMAIQSGFDTLTLLGNLAKAKAAEEKYDEARALLEKSLAVTHTPLASRHPEYARVLNDLGLIDYATGHNDDAETRLLLALQIRKERLGPAHALVAQSLNNLGVVYHRKGDLDQAAALYERALDVSIAALGRNCRRSQRIFSNLDLLGKDRKHKVPGREPQMDDL